VKEHVPSRTAAWVASARALGRHLPQEVRLIDDPYGAAFTEGMGTARVAQAIERANLPILHVPGMLAWVLYMQVRTRVIDNAVEQFVAGGGRQVVILGAGYDCRALRLQLDGATVFEVDHPATQAHKRATLARLAAESPSRYVTWNFEQRPMADLPRALADAGHDAGRPTLTIWEGVTMYLTEQAIDTSLRAIRAWSGGAGGASPLAMTYFAKSRLQRPSLATRAVQAIVARVGEPWRWGWVPDELPAFLAQRGWSVVRDLPMSQAARELLSPDLAKLVNNPDRRVALAAAPESIAVVR
jgi:methyltransferase (TIGR00027 family)